MFSKRHQRIRVPDNHVRLPDRIVTPSLGCPTAGQLYPLTSFHSSLLYSRNLLT